MDTYVKIMRITLGNEFQTTAYRQEYWIHQRRLN